MYPTSVPARLADAGVTVLAGDAYSLTYRVDGRAVTADLVVTERVHSAATVLSRVRRHPDRRILIVCETVADEARAALLQNSEVDLSIGSTGELVLSGKVYRGAAPARSSRLSSERSWRRRAVERVCALTREPLRQGDIAAAVGVSQQAVSKMAERDPLPDTPMTESARRELLTALSSVSAGDGLIETYWYGMDPVVEQVRSTIRLGDELTVRILAGGEVAADALRPWRVPTTGLVYAEELVDLTDLGLVLATEVEATLTVRVPADPTVWTTAAWWQRVGEMELSPIPTVDPVVVLEDLSGAGDLDDGATLRLTEWIAHR